MQEVRKDLAEDKIRVKLIGPGYQGQTITSGEAAVYNPGGGEVRVKSSVGVTFSGSQAELSLPWPWDYDFGFSVKFHLTVGVDVFVRTIYFSIVRRLFHPTLTQDIVFEFVPSLKKFLNKTTPDFSPYLQAAWEQIRDYLQNKLGKRGSQTINTERLRNAHMFLSLAEFYTQNASGTSTDQWGKAERYEKKGMDALAIALQAIIADCDSDGLVDEEELDSSSDFHFTRSPL